LFLNLIGFFAPSPDGAGGDIEFFGDIVQGYIGPCLQCQNDLNLGFVAVPLAGLFLGRFINDWWGW
jgi:hypothetical protein